MLFRSYTVWQELNTPAKVTAQWSGPAERAPEGFAITVTPNTEHNLPFYPLRDYGLRWSVVDEQGKTLVSGARPPGELTQAVSVTGVLPADARAKRYRLKVELLGPTGLDGAQVTLEWPLGGRSDH